jgi:thiol-disulfide isomerase/thioredoxin
MGTANRIVTAVAGAILIIASVLKIYQLLTEPIISAGFWESWEFFLIQIPLELGLGIWLLSGLFRKAAWVVALLAFGIFIIVTLQKGLTGEKSCGCFGPVEVDPWITLSCIDITLFLGLLIFRPKGAKLLPPPWPRAAHFFGVAIPTFILMAVIIPVLIFNKPPDKTNRYEVVRPEKQAGEEWSMLKHIDIAESLRSGITVVLLYHDDCPDCREAIPLYDRISRELLTGGEGLIQIAFVEIPPYGSQEDSPIPPDTPCLTGRLDASKKWYITTPLIVATVDGSVVKAWECQTPTLDEILDAVAGG